MCSTYLFDYKDLDKVTEYIDKNFKYIHTYSVIHHNIMDEKHKVKLFLTGSEEDIKLICEFIFNMLCDIEKEKFLQYQKNLKNYYDAREKAHKNTFRKILDFLLGDWESRNYYKYK